MDELKSTIDLKPLTDEMIEVEGFTLEQLWMIKTSDNEIFGPYDTQSLKDYSKKYQYLFDETLVCNLANKKWVSFFSVKLFQRRKPRLVSDQNLLNVDEFILIKEGQKIGPFKQEEVQDMLDKGDILPSIQASLNKGKTWIKLYEYHAFDRRTLKSTEQLPFNPDEKTLTQVNLKELINKDKVETQDALADLAFIGQGNDKDSDIPLPEQKVKKAKKSAKFNMPAIIAASLLLVGGGFFFFQQESSMTNRSFQAKTEKVGIENSSRDMGKRAPASVKKNTRKIIPKTRSFKRNDNKGFTRKAPKLIRENQLSKKELLDTEMLDINDPVIQEELTRQLAGEYELDGEIADPNDAPDPAFEDIEEELPYNEEERIEHTTDDY